MTQPKVPVIDLSPQEFAALSALEGDQAEQRFESRRRAATRNARVGTQKHAGPRSVRSGGPAAGVHQDKLGSGHHRRVSARPSDVMPGLFGCAAGAMALTCAFAGLGLIWLVGRVMEIITGGGS